MGTKETALSLLQNTSVMELPDYMKATEPSAMGGGLGTGGGRNRIGLKACRFRLIEGGDEVAVKDENFLDVVVVNANPHVSRMYYAGKYDPTVKIAPTCFSSDGITPYEGVQVKQSEKCNGCPQNVKGSAVTEAGEKRRACSFSKRLVVMLDGDENQNLYQIDLKSMSIFGDGTPEKGLYTLAGYNKLLHSKNVRVEALVTRLSFDTASSVPKVFFTPSRFLTETQVKDVLKISNSQEAKDMTVIDTTTLQPDNPIVTVASPPNPDVDGIISVPSKKTKAKTKVLDMPATDEVQLAAALKELTS